MEELQVSAKAGAKYFFKNYILISKIMVDIILNKQYNIHRTT